MSTKEKFEKQVSESKELLRESGLVHEFNALFVYAANRIKELELDLVLSQVSIRQGKELLASCETALAGRDDRIEELKSQANWYLGQFKGIRLYTQEGKIAGACAEAETKFRIK